MKFMKQKNKQAAPKADDFKPELPVEQNLAQPSPLPIEPLTNSFRRSALIKIALPLLIIATLAIVGGVAYFKGGQKHIVVCTETVNARANSAIEKQDKTTLAHLSNDILRQKQYSHDQNCLYILTRSSIIRKDWTEARHDVNLLKKVYDGTHTYSSTFTDQIQPQPLEKLITAGSARQDEVNKNSLEDTRQLQTLNQAADEQSAGSVKP